MNQRYHLAACLSLTVFGIVFSLGRPITSAQETHFEEISSLATGGRFYLDMDTFEPAGGGKLRYNVIGYGQGTGDRVSLNEIDCATGQLKSPIESWSENRQGQTTGQIPGPQGPVTVSKRTKLHDLLQDACNRYLPGTQVDW